MKSIIAIVVSFALSLIAQSAFAGGRGVQRVVVRPSRQVVVHRNIAPVVVQQNVAAVQVRRPLIARVVAPRRRVIVTQPLLSQQFIAPAQSQFIFQSNPIIGQRAFVQQSTGCAAFFVK